MLGNSISVISQRFWPQPALLVTPIFLSIAALLAPWLASKSLAISLESEFPNTPK